MSIIFDEESIYEFSKQYLINFEWVQGRTHGHAHSNMPLQLFQSWEHNHMTLRCDDLESA